MIDFVAYFFITMRLTLCLLEIKRNGGNLDQDSSLEEYECTQKKLVKVAIFY